MTFHEMIKEKLLKILSTNGMNCTLNSSNLGQDITQCVKLGTLLILPQQGQNNKPVLNSIILLIY